MRVLTVDRLIYLESEFLFLEGKNMYIMSSTKGRKTHHGLPTNKRGGELTDHTNNNYVRELSSISIPCLATGKLRCSQTRPIIPYLPHHRRIGNFQKKKFIFIPFIPYFFVVKSAGIDVKYTEPMEVVSSTTGSQILLFI